MTSFRIRRRALAAIAATALALTACGSDDGEEEGTAPEASEPEATEPAPEPTSEEEMGMEPQTYEVTGTDYAFAGIPTEMAAGSTITFTNASEAEVHEVVAINFGDDERPVFDLIVEMQGAMESGDAEAIAALDVQLVIIQGPGGEPTIPAVGDGTLNDPGRYVFLCAIQQGVSPEDYFAESARMQEAGEEGPVVIEGAGQPHAALGMVGEARVV